METRGLASFLPKKRPPEWTGSELRRCAYLGNLDRVRELVLLERVDVNCPDDCGLTPLHWAVNQEHGPIVRFLLENSGANVHEVVAAVDHIGNTPLSHAVLKNNVGLVTLLLDYGADIEATQCREGASHGPSSLLGIAIHQRSIDMVTLFLGLGTKTDRILFFGEMCSALSAACRHDHHHKVRTVYRRTIAGDTMGVVQILLNHEGGRVYINSFFPHCLSVNKNKTLAMMMMSPLCWACRGNRLDLAQLLIQNAAKVILAPGDHTSVDSPCPLRHAVANGSLELVQFLLDNSPFSKSSAASEKSPPLTPLDPHHPLSPPLDVALRDNKLEAAQLLVDHGANVNDGPFLWRCVKANTGDGRAHFLIRNGADVNQADGDSGETPLWAAAFHGKVELVQDILEAGANVNVCDKNGETPLGLAYRKGHKGIVYLLLRTSPHVWSRLKDAL